MPAHARSIRTGPFSGGLSHGVRSFCVLVLTTVVACSSGGGPSQTGPSVSLSLSPTSGSVAQGATLQFTATATGSSDFTGTVSFNITGAPSGVTVAVGAPQQSGTTFTAAVTVTAGAAATTGGATLTVTATGTGGLTSSKTFALTVTSSGGGGNGSFTLAAAPSTFSLAQGASSQVTITITRSGGFTGAVAFTATGAPTGLTATFNPASTTGTTTTLTLTASASLASGAHPLTITGTGAATPTQQSVQVTPTVTSGSSRQYVLDFSGCGTLTPLWVAYQDGTGPWTQVTGVNGVYTFTLTNDKSGWAFTQSLGGIFSTVVNWFTQADIPSGPATTLCPIRKTNNVTLAGVTANDQVLISLGSGQAEWFGGLQTVAISNIFAGTHDLVAYRGSLPPAPSPAATDRAFILRDLNAASGASVGTIDFNGANAIVPIPATMSVANPTGGDQLSYSLQYATGGTASCTSGVLSSVNGTAATSTLMYGIPAASQRPTDFHQLSVTATSSPTTEQRTVIQSFHLFANHAVTLGPMLPTPTMTDLNLAAYRRLQAVATIPTEYPTQVTLQYINNTALKTVSIQASRNWLGGATATMTMPDFTAVAGWNSSWMPPAGQGVNWTLFATRIDDYLTTTLTPNCVENSLFMAGYRKGTM